MGHRLAIRRLCARQTVSLRLAYHAALSLTVGGIWCNVVCGQ